MIDSLWTTRLLHIGWGVALYAVFQGWGVLSETTRPDAPPRRHPNANAFVFGQAVAIMGTVGLALLCGRVLFQTLQTHGWEVLALWVAAMVTLSEGVSAALDLPQVRERVPITPVDFQSGRNLVLRYGAALFLGLVSVGAWLGPATSAMVAGGCVVGWVWTQSMSGPRSEAGLATTVRWAAAVLGLGMSAMLLRAAWKWTI